MTPPAGSACSGQPFPMIAVHNMSEKSQPQSTPDPQPVPGPSTSPGIKAESGAESESRTNLSETPGASSSQTHRDKQLKFKGYGKKKAAAQPQSAVHGHDPDATLESLGSFQADDLLTESSSWEDLRQRLEENGALGSSRSDANDSGKKNRNQSSVLDTRQSPVTSVHWDARASAESDIQVFRKMETSATSHCSLAEDSCDVQAFTASLTDIFSDTKMPALPQYLPTKSLSNAHDSSSMHTKMSSSTEDLASSCTDNTGSWCQNKGAADVKGDGSGQCWDHPSEAERGPGLEHLPREVLMTLARYLPTVSLIACAAAHQSFSELLTDVQFLNRHTRQVLGFAANDCDITYHAVPAPVAPLQNLCYQTYLHQTAPYAVGLVTPGVVFYDLLCFKHLLDTWILQGVAYNYRERPPLEFIRTTQFTLVSPPMLNMLTKLALCHPHILLQTVNNFESFTIGSTPRHRITQTLTAAVPEEDRSGFIPKDTCEVVSRERGSSPFSLASFCFTFDSRSFLGWSGAADYSTFRWKETWSACKFPAHAPLSLIRQRSQPVMDKFSEFVGPDFISAHCSRAFMFRDLCRSIQGGKALLLQLQSSLERKVLKIHAKVRKALSEEKLSELKTFMDGVAFLDSVPGPEPPRRKRHGGSSSRTLEVAMQRYLHRYLNLALGGQVLRLYRDGVCHHVLCITCHNDHNHLYHAARKITAPPSALCLEQVSYQRIPFRMWPPHLLQHALTSLQALTRLVCIDVELWTRSMLDQPLPHKVSAFVRHTLRSVHVNVGLDAGETGVIARRLVLQK